LGSEAYHITAGSEIDVSFREPEEGSREGREERHGMVDFRAFPFGLAGDNEAFDQ
jgi:hypothetical protein